VLRIERALGISLVKKSRAGYVSPDKSVALNCAVSKEHPNYWFAFHPHQRAFLKQYEKAYVGFGCGASSRVLLIPYADFEPWLEGASMTILEDRSYWHILIYREQEKYMLRRKKGAQPIELTRYLISDAA
jgi:hypothetical protein